MSKPSWMRAIFVLCIVRLQVLWPMAYCIARSFGAYSLPHWSAKRKTAQSMISVRLPIRVLSVSFSSIASGVGFRVQRKYSHSLRHGARYGHGQVQVRKLVSRKLVYYLLTMTKRLGPLAYMYNRSYSLRLLFHAHSQGIWGTGQLMPEYNYEYSMVLRVFQASFRALTDDVNAMTYCLSQRKTTRSLSEKRYNVKGKLSLCATTLGFHSLCQLRIIIVVVIIIPLTGTL